jgi:hypothetical protein
LKIAHELKDSDVSVLEQEWKPRTRQEDLKVLGNRVEMVEKKRKKKKVC